MTDRPVDAAVARLRKACDPACGIDEDVLIVCDALAEARQEIAEALEEAEACGQVMVKSRSEREAEADSRTAIERLARVIAEGDLEKARQQNEQLSDELERVVRCTDECERIRAELERQVEVEQQDIARLKAAVGELRAALDELECCKHPARCTCYFCKLLAAGAGGEA